MELGGLGSLCGTWDGSRKTAHRARVGAGIRWPFQLGSCNVDKLLFACLYCCVSGVCSAGRVPLFVLVELQLCLFIRKR